MCGGKFHFCCGRAFSYILVTTAFSCYGFHFIYMHVQVRFMQTDEGYSLSRIMCVALTCCSSRLYVSIRKVLRPAISSQVLLGFPVSLYKRMLGWFPVLQVAIAVFNGRQLPTMLRCRLHDAAQGRKRETFQVPKESSVVYS